MCRCQIWPLKLSMATRSKVINLYLKIWIVFSQAINQAARKPVSRHLALKVKQALHSVIFRKFPQKCAPSVDRFKPIRERLQKTKKVKANAQGYSHLPTHLMVPTYRSNTNLLKKISLGTQIFIFCQIWLIENSTMSSKQILIGQLWTREGANIQKITQWGVKYSQSWIWSFLILDL